MGDYNSLSRFSSPVIETKFSVCLEVFHCSMAFGSTEYFQNNDWIPDFNSKYQLSFLSSIMSEIAFDSPFSLYNLLLSMFSVSFLIILYSISYNSFPNKQEISESRFANFPNQIQNYLSINFQIHVTPITCELRSKLFSINFK